MDGWIRMFEIDGDEKVAAVRYVNRRNIVSINQEGGGRISTVMNNGDAVGMPEMPPVEPSVPTAKDYVQDGLVAMWDGIENAGWGVHVDELTEWPDLMGGEPCAITKASVLSNGIRFNYHWATRGGTFNRVFQWQNATFEVVCSDIEPGTSTRFLFQSGCSTNRDPSVAIAYTAGRINTLTYYMGNGSSYVDGPNGMLGGTYSVTTSTDIASFLLYRNGLAAEYAGTGRWNIQTGHSACLAYRGTDNSKINFPSVTVHGVRVYARALTAEEIARNYAIDKARFNLP